MLTFKLTLLPSLAKATPIILYSVLTSTLPPDTTHTTFSPASGLYFPLNKAAVETAPAPSDTIFWLSIMNNIACAISSSSTTTTSSTNSFIISNVKSPGVLTAIPSAIVGALNADVTSPFWNDSFIEGILAVWTPITLQLGFNAFATTATPATIPPPPIGHNTVSTLLSNCSKNSNAKVPWPAITYLSLNGCRKVAPVSFCTSTALAYASS